jgi:hypothetical protein
MAAGAFPGKPESLTNETTSYTDLDKRQLDI